MKNSTYNKTNPSAVDDCAQAVNESWQVKRRKQTEAQVAEALLLRSPLEMRETVYGSDDYKTTLELRHNVLRAPLGLNLWHENLSVESQQRHFSLWQQPNILLACVVIVPLVPRGVKLRQMAVSPEHQKQGLGQHLISEVEKILLAEGIGTIELHARISALAFYRACGYKAVGEVFTEVGIDHQCMVKIINPEVAGR